MKLKWSLAELHKTRGGIYPIDGQANLEDALKRRNRELLEVSLVDVQGSISMEGRKRYYVDLMLHTTLTLPSSRSLEPVTLDLSIPYNEIFLAPDAKVQDEEDLSEEDVVFSLEMDILDLRKPIEDTILASIPMKVLSKEEQESDELPTGKHWELRLEDDHDSRDSSSGSTDSKSSPFDVLKDLFKEEDEE